MFLRQFESPLVLILAAVIALGLQEHGVGRSATSMAAKQILLNNFLSDIPSVAISSDYVDPEPVARPQHWNIKDIQRFMIVFGLISSIFDLVTFKCRCYFSTLISLRSRLFGSSFRFSLNSQ